MVNETTCERPKIALYFNKYKGFYPKIVSIRQLEGLVHHFDEFWLAPQSRAFCIRFTDRGVRPIAEKYLRSFTARENMGPSHSIRVYQDFTNDVKPDGRVIEVAGPFRLATSTGIAIDKLEKGRYLLVERDVEIYSEDPGAF